MLNVQLDVSGLQKALEDMAAQIEAFPQKMTAEFLEWQRTDLKRRYPSDENPEANIAATTIVHRRPGRARPGRGRPSARRLQTRRNRPILRPELFEALCERMSTLLGTIKWG